MADVTVTGLTAARMKEIEAASIIDAELAEDGQLTFITQGGQRIEVGTALKGPKGDIGPGGVVTSVNGKTGSEITLTAADIGAATKAALDSLVPAGTIVMTGRSSAPSGWVLCQGQPLNKSDYVALYAAIGTAYGANSATFNVPNLKGRVPVGRDTNDDSFDTLGETGGAKTVTLSESQMPAHSHTLLSSTTTVTATSSAVGGGSTSDNGGNSLASGLTGGRFTRDVQINGRTRETGGGNSHNNLQPYQVVNYMIKI